MDRSYFDVYLGNALFEARVVKRISQEQMANMTNEVWLSDPDCQRKNGCSRSTYTRYERGEISMPMGFYKSACKVLNLDWKQLFKEAQAFEFNHIDEIDKDK